MRELDEASDALSDLASQGDLFSGRLDELREATDVARGALESAVAAVDASRHELEQIRAAEVEAADRAAGLEARVRALQALERDREGMEPVVQAALEAGLPGIHGPLVDFVRADGTTVKAVASSGFFLILVILLSIDTERIGARFSLSRPITGRLSTRALHVAELVATAVGVLATGVMALSIPPEKRTPMGSRAS